MVTHRKDADHSLYTTVTYREEEEEDEEEEKKKKKRKKRKKKKKKKRKKLCTHCDPASFLYVQGVFKKRLNLLNNAPTSKESALQLLSAPSVRF
jgi:acetyl-CoA carboxylase carboxyltransferase component